MLGERGVAGICPTIILTPMGEQIWSDPAKGKPMLDKTPPTSSAARRS